MEVLTAFLTDPGLRPDVLDRIKAALPSGYAGRRISPDDVYSLKASGDVYSQNARFVTPSQQDALAIDNESIKALLKDQLGHGPVDVTSVRDIASDEAIAQVGATLGALPKLPAVLVPGADRLQFPTKDLHKIYTHDGSDDQNLRASQRIPARTACCPGIDVGARSGETAERCTVMTQPDR